MSNFTKPYRQESYFNISQSVPWAETPARKKKLSAETRKGLKSEWTKTTLAQYNSHTYSDMQLFCHFNYPCIETVYLQADDWHKKKSSFQQSFVLLNPQYSHCPLTASFSHHSEVSNVQIFYVYFFRGILNLGLAMELPQTRGCISFSVALWYIHRSSWMISDFKTRAQPFINGLSVNLCLGLQPPVFSRLARAAGSFLWPELLTSGEQLSWGWEGMKRIEWRGDRRTKCE